MGQKSLVKEGLFTFENKTILVWFRLKSIESLLTKLRITFVKDSPTMCQYFRPRGLCWVQLIQSYFNLQSSKFPIKNLLCLIQNFTIQTLKYMLHVCRVFFWRKYVKKIVHYYPFNILLFNLPVPLGISNSCDAFTSSSSCHQMKKI